MNSSHVDPWSRQPFSFVYWEYATYCQHIIPGGSSFANRFYEPADILGVSCLVLVATSCFLLFEQMVLHGQHPTTLLKSWSIKEFFFTVDHDDGDGAKTKITAKMSSDEAKRAITERNTKEAGAKYRETMLELSSKLSLYVFVVSNVCVVMVLFPMFHPKAFGYDSFNDMWKASSENVFVVVYGSIPDTWLRLDLPFLAWPNLKVDWELKIAIGYALKGAEMLLSTYIAFYLHVRGETDSVLHEKNKRQAEQAKLATDSFFLWLELILLASVMFDYYLSASPHGKSVDVLGDFCLLVHWENIMLYKPFTLPFASAYTKAARLWLMMTEDGKYGSDEETGTEESKKSVSYAGKWATRIQLFIFFFGSLIYFVPAFLVGIPLIVVFSPTAAGFQFVTLFALLVVLSIATFVSNFLLLRPLQYFLVYCGRLEIPDKHGQDFLEDPTEERPVPFDEGEQTLELG